MANAPERESVGRNDMPIRLTLSRKAWVGFGVAAALLLGWVYWNSPDESHAYLPCLWHQITGWHCPGCGGQRALYHLLHAEPAVAWDYNPLLVIAVLAAPVFPVWHIFWGLPAWLQKSMQHGAVWVAVLFFLLLYAVLRNLPWAPFHNLAP